MGEAQGVSLFDRYVQRFRGLKPAILNARKRYDEGVEAGLTAARRRRHGQSKLPGLGGCGEDLLIGPHRRLSGFLRLYSWIILVHPLYGVECISVFKLSAEPEMHLCRFGGDA